MSGPLVAPRQLNVRDLLAEQTAAIFDLFDENDTKEVPPLLVDKANYVVVPAEGTLELLQFASGAVGLRLDALAATVAARMNMFLTELILQPPIVVAHGDGFDVNTVHRTDDVPLCPRDVRECPDEDLAAATEKVVSALFDLARAASAADALAVDLPAAFAYDFLANFEFDDDVELAVDPAICDFLSGMKCIDLFR